MAEGENGVVVRVDLTKAVMSRPWVSGQTLRGNSRVVVAVSDGAYAMRAE